MVHRDEQVASPLIIVLRAVVAVANAVIALLELIRELVD
nr:DinQ-like type I toxin DqlB [Escherichia coli]